MNLNIRKKIIALAPKSQFNRAASVLVGGAASAQLMTVLASPLLTRLYAPEDFGLLAICTALLSFFIVIASLKYELAIPLPESDLEATKLLYLSLLILMVLTILSMFVILAFGNEISILFRIKELNNYLWLLPLVMFVQGAYQVFSYWAVRKKAFSVIAKTKLHQAITSSIIKIVGFKLGGISLLLGYVAGQGIGTIRLARLAFYGKSSGKMGVKNLLETAYRYRRFPQYSTFSGLINTGGQQITPLALAILFSPAAAGLFSLANSILALPIKIIGGAVGQVFLSQGAECHRDGKLAPLVVAIYQRLSLLILPVSLFLIIFSPLLFSTIFGKEWEKAGVMAQGISILMIGQFLCAPISQVLTIVEKQQISMYLNAIMFLARAGILVYVGKNYGLMAAVMAYSSASFAGYMLFIFFIFKHSGAGPVQAVVAVRWQGALFLFFGGVYLYIEKLSVGSMDYVFLYLPYIFFHLILSFFLLNSRNVAANA